MKISYHARNAARRPKTPPAFKHPGCGAPSTGCKYAIPSNKNAMSSVKNREKNATVDVQMRRTVVKMNHPYDDVSIIKLLI